MGKEVGNGGTDMEHDAIKPCGREEKEFIINNLIAFNREQMRLAPEEDSADLSRVITGADGKPAAGIIAMKYMKECVCVEILWVDERHRKEGLGSRLLEAVEAEAKKQGCTILHLDTFDFQAKDFYLKHGFEIFGCLKDCPAGHERYYLSKRL